MWLTVPIERPSQSVLKSIQEIKIDNSRTIKRYPWRDYIVYQIKQAYNKSEHFDEIFPDLEEILRKDHESLADLNIRLIENMFVRFNIKKEIHLSSQLTRDRNITSKATQKLIDLCQAIGADTYVSGNGARDYLDEKLFEREGLKLEYQQFQHPIYRQINNKKLFVKYLSAIDFLFNEGEEK